MYIIVSYIVMIVLAGLMYRSLFVFDGKFNKFVRFDEDGYALDDSGKFTWFIVTGLIFIPVIAIVGGLGWPILVALYLLYIVYDKTIKKQ